jgi:hypothetical protein
VTQIIDYDPFVAPEIEQVIATTPAQKEIWSAARMGQGASCAFNESISLRLRGNLDVAALRQALGQLVEHHEALRCTLSPFDGKLCIASELGVELPLEDLSGQSSEEQQQRLREILAAEVETAFDLEQGPLLRTRLLRLEPSDYWFILSAHHIICDGWSMAVVLRDLGLFIPGRVRVRRHWWPRRNLSALTPNGLPKTKRPRPASGPDNSGSIASRETSPSCNCPRIGHTFRSKRTAPTGTITPLSPSWFRD